MNDRPNILLITTDQQRFDTLQVAGNRCIYTPHLNWLCDCGTRFTRAYSESPACVPARASIMMGKPAYDMGLTHNRYDVRPIRSEASLPGLLTRAGYQTRAVGKMHFAPMRCHYGFEHMELLDDYYRDMARQPERGIPMDHGLGQNEMTPAISTVDESHSLTRWIVERALNFLETRDPTRPFFLWMSFSKPHPPLDPCRSYWDLYHDRPVPPPVCGDWSATPAQMPAAWRRSTHMSSPPERYSPEQLLDIRRAYYACITQVDYNLGILLGRMREMGMDSRTWTLFASDHGEMLGDHHCFAKSVGFEGSAHVPMIVTPPQGKNPWAALRNQTCDQLASLADLMPTCLSLAGQALPADNSVSGCNLLEMAAGQNRRQRLFGELDHFQYLLQGRFKLLYETETGSTLLFDLEADPYEQHDLVASPAHASVLSELRDVLTRELQRRNHPAVAQGRLAPVSVDPVAIQPNHWPGFHSRHECVDVGH